MTRKLLLVLLALVGGLIDRGPEPRVAPEPIPLDDIVTVAGGDPADGPQTTSPAAPLEPEIRPGGTLLDLPDAERRALPDTIGVLMERRAPGPPGGEVEEYLLWLPPGLERTGKRWPVVLYLHGRSLRGSDTAMLLRYGLPRELAEGGAIPFIVVAPQARNDGGWRDADRLALLLEDVLRRYPVDRDRVYLTGYSMGGGGVWRMLEGHANLFAAAVPMAAHTPPPSDAWARALARLPVKVYHGTADEAAPIEPARTMVAAMRRAGRDITLEEIRGADHGALTKLYRDPALYGWLLAHRRGG